MVCIYCGHSSTSVTNSRQHASARIWRRRSCQACKNSFTTYESAHLPLSARIQKTDDSLEAFSYERLFLSLYESCKHRPQGLIEAANLTHTVIAKLLPLPNEGLIPRNHLITTVHETLQRFDPAAASIYVTYHPAT